MLRTLIGLPLVLTWIAAPVQGELIHKWVDADGVTHYADEPPARAATPVTRIEVPLTPRRARNPDDDYYSIGRQWQRMHAERLEREKIALEKARIRAEESARAAAAVVPEAEPTRYRVGYPLIRHHRHRLMKPRHGPLSAGKWPPGLHPGRNRLAGGYDPLP